MRSLKGCLLGIMVALNFNVLAEVNDGCNNTKFILNVYENSILNFINITSNKALISTRCQELIELTTEPLVADTAKALGCKVLLCFLSFTLLNECFQMMR
ncbi:MAG: hypothetical protein WD055_06305 [Candidatus Dependentiae bacterium]